MRILLVALLLAGGVLAQRHKANINTETPEGQLLQTIGQESDDAKKLALCEKFTGDYTKSENLAWVYSEMQPLYTKLNQPDKALAIGDKLIALDPDDLETALATLKAAEAKKDPDLVKKWSNTSAAIAQKVIASPQPKDEDEADAWKKRVDYAKQVNTYSEYSIDAMALTTPDPHKKVDLIEALYDRDSQSQYMAQLLPVALQSLQQMNDSDRSVAFAEKVLAKEPNNDELLLVAANGYLQKGKEPDKVISYSNKLVEVINSKPKPDGVSDADWTSRKNTITGLAHYMIGKQYFNEKKYGPADKALRSALPLVETNAALKPEVLFLLGFSNYKMENIAEALKFNQQCAAIKSPFQAQAAKNVTVIKSQYRAVRQ
jgi:tetratricopeptide (TPR) repeat protein